MPRRVVVDTNVWVSALLNPRGFPAQVLEALKQRRFIPILSPPLIEELREVLARPRLRRYGIRDEDVEELIALLTDRAIWVEPTGKLHLCHDPDDDLILETALLGLAGAMVTRDDDIKRDLELLRWMREQGIPVLSVSQFLELLKEGEETQ
jgi:putative PIN family toxin of toxin-antitoxin system